MTATLPGDIPGLLRRGSVIIHTEGGYRSRGVVLDHNTGAWWVCLRPTGGEERPPVEWAVSSQLALDLTDPTSRAHAAWWLCEQNWDDVEAAIREHAGSLDAARLIEWWASGRDCTPASIEALRRVVLHVAGRAS